MRLHLLLLTAVVGLACRDSAPNGRLADAYVDLLRFRDRTARADTADVRIGIDSLLAVHGFNAETYRSAFAALADDPAQLQAFFVRVDERITATNPALQPSR